MNKTLNALQYAAHSGATRVSLSVRGCDMTQSELDNLNHSIQNETGRHSTKLEHMAKQVQVEKQAFSAKLQEMLSIAGIDLNHPLSFTHKNARLVVTCEHPQSSLINQILFSSHSLIDDFKNLEDHMRTLEMGKVATSAYGEWKQNNHAATVQDMTRTAMYQLQNISGGRLINGQLSLSLEGQAHRQINFNRRFNFS